MKILKFTGENVKRLRFVEIKPDPNNPAVVLRGDNEQGKTSVLDAIWYALGGKAGIKGQPVRQGETSAYSEVDLGDFVVKRTWTEKGSYLTISDPRGAKLSNPQSVLDKMMGKLSDPHSLARMSKADQRDVFIDLLGIGEQLRAIDKKIADITTERQEVNRDIKRFKGTYESIQVETEDLPEKEVSVSELMSKVREREEKQREYLSIQSDISLLERNIISEREHVKKLKDELGQALDDLEKTEKKLREQQAVLSTIENPIEAIRNLQEQISGAEQINYRIRRWEEKEDALSRVRVATSNYEGLGQKKNKLEAKKMEILSSAKMPIDGLGIDSDGITFNGLPIEGNASDAQKTLIFASIAMAMDPEIKILKIPDGSLLDDKHMAQLIQLADDNGFQLWIEKVGAEGAGIIIEDGEVKEEM